MIFGDLLTVNIYPSTHFWYHTTPLESSEQCYQSIIHTKIFHKNLLRIQDILILPNKRLVIFQDLLLGVENAQTVWVHATRLLRQCNLDILHSRPIRYVHCRGKIFDRLPRSCRSRLAVAVQCSAVVAGGKQRELRSNTYSAE